MAQSMAYVFYGPMALDMALSCLMPHNYLFQTFLSMQIANVRCAFVIDLLRLAADCADALSAALEPLLNAERPIVLGFGIAGPYIALSLDSHPPSHRRPQSSGAITT